MVKNNGLYAIIPMYNEEGTVGKVVKETLKYVDKVIAVDDGSKDKCYDEAKKAGAIVVKHIINMGLGFTLATGCEKAVSMGAKILVTIDSDGQHDPKEIPKLLKVLKDEKLDIVFGSRPISDKMPVVKKIGNWGIYTGSKRMFSIDVKDTQSGLRMFKSSAYQKIKWRSSRYAVSSEIVMNTGKAKLKYKEVPIKTIYNDNFKGTTIFDGMKIFLNMIWWRLVR